MDTYFTVRDLDINLQIIHCYNGNGQDKSEQWSFHPSWLGWGMNNYPVIYIWFDQATIWIPINQPVFFWDVTSETWDTLPETNSSHLQINGWKMYFHVSFTLED